MNLVRHSSDFSFVISLLKFACSSYFLECFLKLLIYNCLGNVEGCENFLGNVYCECDGKSKYFRTFCAHICKVLLDFQCLMKSPKLFIIFFSYVFLSWIKFIFLNFLGRLGFSREKGKDLRFQCNWNWRNFFSFLFFQTDLQETRVFSLTDFLNSVPKCAFSSCSTPVLTDLETDLINSILQDDKNQLINVTTQALLNGNDNDALQTTASTAVLKILHLCCNLDSVICATALVNGELLGGVVAAVNKMDSATGLTAIHVAAESHAARCVEMLLKKRARTDIKSKDGRGRLALELSLCSNR